jgi:hypothetical protein
MLKLNLSKDGPLMNGKTLEQCFNHQPFKLAMYRYINVGESYTTTMQISSTLARTLPL